MKETNKNDKKCCNCRYFLKHYVIVGINLMPLLEGHCGRAKARVTKKNIPIDKNCFCGNWQPIILQIEDRRDKIKSFLKNIEERLNVIALILKEDTGNDKPPKRGSE